MCVLIGTAIVRARQSQERMEEWPDSDILGTLDPTCVLQPIRKQYFALYNQYEIKFCFLISCRTSYDACRIQCESSKLGCFHMQRKNGNYSIIFYVRL